MICYSYVLSTITDLIIADSRKLSPIVEIALGVGLVGAALLFSLITIVLALCCRKEYKRRRKQQRDVNSNQDTIITELGHAKSGAKNAQDLIDQGIEDKHKESICSWLKQIENHIDEAKAKAESTKRIVTDSGGPSEDPLTEASSKVKQLLQMLGEASEEPRVDSEPSSPKYHPSRTIPLVEIIEYEMNEEPLQTI